MINPATHRDIPKRRVRNCVMRVIMAGSTQALQDDLECQPGRKVLLADAEAIASQQRRHDRQARG